MQRTLFVCLLAMSSATLHAYSDGPVPGRTGAAIDGGLNCTACHFTNRPANVDPRGSLRIEVSPYVPGMKQTIRVLLSHPEARRWGFQLTARLVSDEAKPAGKFSVGNLLKITCGGGAPDGNCATNTEFVEHTQASTFPGQSGGAAWSVTWTPPANDVGEVVFYAAGNAANNNNLNTGDFIYTTNTKVAAQPPCNLTTAPAISVIRNGASFLPTGFALNSMISIGGSGFQTPGTSKATAATDIVDNQFPAQLSCVAVEIDGKPAPIAYTDASQINVQIPTTTALGDVATRVILNPGTPNEKRSAPFTLKLDSSGPAMFRFLPTPCIAAIFPATGGLAADPVLVPNSTKPRVGDIVSIFATGLGVSEPVYLAGEIVPLTAAPKARDQVQIEFNGVVMNSADILYVGLTPGSITGLWQINLRIPATATPGRDNTVLLRMGSLISQAGVVLPIGL
ncbi:MAG: choice-of-anchor V domain-containing protein [Acidobacteriota bacterium]